MNDSVCGHVNGDTTVDVASRFGGTVFAYKTAKSAKEYIIVFCQLLLHRIHKALYNHAYRTLVVPRRDCQFINEFSFCHIFFYCFS